MFIHEQVLKRINQRLLQLVVVLSLGIFSVAANATQTSVSVQSGAVIAVAASPSSGTVLHVELRVKTPSGEVVKNKSESGSASVSLIGAGNGHYNYHSWTMMIDGDGNKTHVGDNRGSFTIYNGSIVPDQEQADDETSALIRFADYVASTALNLLVPEASAQNITVDSVTPTIELEDTSPSSTDTDNREWLIRGTTGSFEILDDTDDANTTLTSVFRIEPLSETTATSADTENSIVVEANGDISLLDEQFFLTKATGKLGLGTTTPEDGIHVVSSGKQQFLRLENTSHSIWQFGQKDTALSTPASDGDFVVRIETNGNGGPTGDAMLIRDETGLVSFPNGVESVSSAGQIQVNEASGADGSVQTLFNLINNGPPAFRFFDNVNNQTWQFRGAQNGSFKIDDPSTGVSEVEILPGGTMRVGGALVQTSSRASKNFYDQVDSQAVLEKLVALPISRWAYKSDPKKAEHMGPVAEDFYAAFGLGVDSSGISSVDTAGATIAAIQALHAQLVEKQERIQALEERLAAVEMDNERWSELEYRVEALFEKQSANAKQELAAK